MSNPIRMKRLAAALALAGALAPTIAAAADAGRPEASPMDRVSAARAKQAQENGGANDRVFGGHDARKGEWPFQVALLVADKLDRSVESQANAQFCGGSLISPEWVLTAAHCLSQDGAAISPASVVVLTGATDLTEGTRHMVKEVIVHEGFSERTLDNDVGLIHLADKASEPTIRIGDKPVSDTGATKVIGWGMMQDGTFPTALQEADIDLQSNKACNEGIKQIYARDLGIALHDLSGRMRYTDAAVSEATAAITKSMADPLTDNMICAGTESGVRDACNGDSGGPLFTKDQDGTTQVGIVSWGEGPFDASAACGHKDAYGVYTRLSNYAGWVKAKTGI